MITDKFKRLVWEDCVTPEGKVKGYVSYVAHVSINKNIHILSFNIGKINVEDKEIHVSFPNWEPDAIVSSIEEGKEVAQKWFEKWVTDNFFEK